MSRHDITDEKWEAVGRPRTEWIAPEDREQVKNKMSSGYEKPYQVTALCKNGTTFPAQIQSKKINFGERSIRVTALRDITDQKQAEEMPCAPSLVLKAGRLISGPIYPAIKYVFLIRTNHVIKPYSTLLKPAAKQSTLISKSGNHKN